MKHRMLTVALLASALLDLAGCVPHFYKGKVAILDASPDVVFVQTSHDWGDCHQYTVSVPTVYRITRTAYVLDIIHGERYWPELLFAARSTSGADLVVTGANVVPVEEPEGGDAQRLKANRGVLPAYGTTSLKPATSPVQLTIADIDGQALGTETLTFRVEAVHCLGVDAI